MENDPGIAAITADATDVLDPNQTFKLRGGREVLIKELNWRDARKFIRALGEKASALFSFGADGVATLNADRMLGVVAADMVELVLAYATDLTAEEIEGLTLTESARLLNVAISLNLRPELVSQGNELATRIKAVMGSVSPTAS